MKDIGVEQLRNFFEGLLFDPVAIDHLLVDVYSNYLIDGKLYRHQLIKFLDERNILHTPHDFFNIHKGMIENTGQTHDSISEVQFTNADSSNDSEGYLQSTREFPKCNKIKKKYKPRGAISAANAAKILGKSERQIRNWDVGTNTPDGYPGRTDEMAFQLFVNQWKKTELLKSQARAMNRPTSGGGIAEHVAHSYDGENDED